jgi:hypothetical protein
MLILPTHKRRNNLTRFIAAYDETKAVEPVLLVIDDNDTTYDDVVLHSNFSILRIPPGLCSSKRENLAFEKYPDEQCYGILADDVVPRTPHWDVIMKEAAGDWGLAYCPDTIHGKKLPTHPFMGGELVRAMGFIDEPTIHDYYSDNCRRDVAHALGLLRPVDNVELVHMHWVNGLADKDDTYKKQWDNNHDAYLYQQWLHFGGFYDTVRRVKGKMDASRSGLI